jgi:AAHS family 3-hydroxyphenylpropionic acid transporter
MSMKNPGWAGMTALLCILAAVCEGVDLQAAGVAAAGITAEFKPQPAQLGTFFSASTFGLLLGALLGGWLSDRRGRKSILVVSVAAFGLFSILTAFAHDVTQLTWARLFTGFGLGGALPNLLALVTELSPDSSKRANLTLVYAAMPLGGALVSLIAMLVPPSSWRLMFITGGVLPLLTAPLMAKFLHESTVFTQARDPGAGAQQDGGFVRMMSEGRALPSLLLWTSFFLGLLILYLLLNWLPTLMIGRGMSPGTAAAAQIAFNAGGAIAAIGLGRFLDGKHRLTSVVLIVTSMPLLVWMLAATSSQGAVIVAIVLVMGCAVLALQAFLNASAPMIYPAAVRGLGVGLAVAMGRLGAVVGPKLAGSWKAAGLDTTALLYKLLPIVVAASVATMVLALVADRRRTKSAA